MASNTTLRQTQVPFAGIQGGELVAQLPVALLQRGQLLVLWQATSAVLEPGQLGVNLGQVQEP